MIDIKHTEEEAYQIVTVEGEVDASSSIHLDNVMSEAISREKNILVDLSGLSYISSAGLGVFMSYLKELETHNLNLVLTGLNEKVYHVFEILGLDQLLKIEEDLEKGKAALHGV